MPVLSRHHLANKFRQNWMAKYPTDNNGNNLDMCDINLDDSLTSLSWLQNLNIMKITSPNIVQSTPDSARLSTHNIMHNYSQQITITDSPPGLTSPSSLEPVDYKNNPYVKPPYSYATLICMAMKETRSPKITLSAIYNWITDNFMYYRLADPSWQNSIRHNLSLNKCFQKVPRRKDEPGKGGFWSINPEYSDMLENGIFKKRRASRESAIYSPTSLYSPPPSMCSPTMPGPPPLKRIKSEPIDDGYSSSYSYYSPDDSNNRIVHFNCEEDDEKITLSGDFSWTSILNQDIQVGGYKVKTEHLLDEAESAVEPLIAMNSPESATEDLGLEELLASADFTTESVTWVADDPLDLTVTGHTIRAPEWWSEDMNMSLDAGKENMGDTYNSSRNGLNTPVSSSPVHESSSESLHPWADDRSYFDQLALAFDVDNIFEDFGNIPSPSMS